MRMRDFRNLCPEAFRDTLPFEGCQFCRAQCRYRTAGAQLASRRDLVERALRGWHEADQRDLRDLIKQMTAPLLEENGNRDLVWCAWLTIQQEERVLHELADFKSIHTTLMAL